MIISEYQKELEQLIATLISYEKVSEELNIVLTPHQLGQLAGIRKQIQRTLEALKEIEGEE